MLLSLAKESFVFSEEDGVTCVCVCLRCVLAKCVMSLARLWEIKGGRWSKMPIVEMFVEMVFICSMGYLVCVCAARLVVSKETKWRYDRVKKAARIVGRARDCVRCSLAKAMFTLVEMNFGVTVSFVRLVERRALSPLKWPRGELRARCRELNFGGDIKLCLCMACWMYLIYIQLGFLARNP